MVYNNKYDKDNERDNWILNEMMIEKAGIDLTPRKTENKGHFSKERGKAVL